MKRISQDITSLGIGYSSDSSILTTWLIVGLCWALGSTHLKAVKRALLRADVDGLVSRLGSTTWSARLAPTIILSQSTRFFSCTGRVSSTGSLPVMDSKSTTPKLYTSLFSLRYPLLAYSGATYLSKHPKAWN